MSIRPGTRNFAGGRWEPFVTKIRINNVDLTDATLLMQIRAARDAPGAALVDLSAAISSAQGLSFTVDSSGPVPVSTIQIRINESTMEGLTPPTEVGADAVLYYDLQITRPGVHDKVRYLKGTFTVEAGVTH